ncbi:MAG: hypothetical protein JNM83_02600 [Myxococcales bacterium]|jgi:hypothetical protein|nr:hypothetical protein [Myxococcales bacterium]
MKKPLNILLLTAFAPILIVAGILGFLTPPSLALMSGAAPYNLFHIFFGLVGIGLLLTKRLPLARAFNVGFGAVDLYQAVASFAGLFPTALFAYKRADDVLHIVLGLLLVGVGLFADRKSSPPA